MPAALLILQLILPILAQLPQLIQTAEKAFSRQPSSGAAKKELVLTIVGKGLDVAGAVGAEEVKPPEVREAILGAASSLTDAIVAGFNIAELFKQRDEPAAP